MRSVGGWKENMKQQKQERGRNMDKCRKEKDMRRERKYQRRKAEDEIRGKSQQFGGFVFLLTLVFLEIAQHWETFLFLSF